MPYISIVLNKKTSSIQPLLKKISKYTSETLQKPEKFVMVSAQINKNIIFSGNSKPLAYIEFKSLDLDESKTGVISKEFCAIIAQFCSIKAERVYIEFSSGPRHMWGWNAKTFSN